MKKYAIKSITVDQVQNNYNTIVESYVRDHAHKKVKPEELTDKKEVSDEMVSLLMLLGLEKMNLLSKMLRNSHDIPEFTEADVWEVYCLCDGFGKRTPEELKEINEGWDWSHVRDSSPEAVKEACELVVKKLVDIYNKA